MAKRNARADPPGDIRLDPRELVKEQQLDAQEELLVSRMYSLFDHFKDKLRAVHDEMRDARSMRQLKQSDRSRTSPASNTMNSCIDNVIADQIDNMPEAVMVPEREETANTADEMTDVVSFVLYQSGWPGKFNQIMEDAAVTGTGVAQVFWNDDAMDGEGMADVIAWHPEDFYPDPMYENIQDGRACFKTTMTTVAWIEEHYPHVRGYVHGDDIRDDDPMDSTLDIPDGDQKVTLLECWYKRYDAKKRKYRVHMAQMAGKALLYSTELGYGGASKEEYRQGVYAHGQYPFVLYKYRDVWREPFGTGLVHDYRDTQSGIDRYIKYIDDNARESSIQRHFVRRGSGINVDQIADMSQTIIEWEGSDIREVLQTVQATPLNGQVYQIMQYLTDAMKQDSGQNQFARGEGGLGVTAAGAIQALQEAGGKITRWHVFQYKDAFREMIEQILWILSEYLDSDRKIRIVGGWDSGGAMEDRIVQLMAPNKEGDELPKPAYAVRVQTQKGNPYWTEQFNQLMLQASQVSAQSGKPIPPDIFISMLQGYPDKARVVKMLKESGTMHDQIAQLQAQNEELMKKIEGMSAVVNSQRKALGSPSIQRNTQQSAPKTGAQSGADYAPMTEKLQAAMQGGGSA